MRTTAIAVVLVMGTGMNSIVEAETMTSETYSVQGDVLNMGGGTSTSDTYSANDSIGEMATGEDLASETYSACAGFECFANEKYITFDVRSGTSAPGSSGGSVNFGVLSSGAVKTSDGSSINSVFLTAEGNAPGGIAITVRDANNGLKRDTTADLIASASATLVAGTAGYGVCVFSVTQDGGSPTALSKASPYNGDCTKTTGHAVGAVSTTPANILTSSGQLLGGSAEVLVKASIGAGTAAGPDYSDTLTFIATGTY